MSSNESAATIDKAMIATIIGDWFSDDPK